MPIDRVAALADIDAVLGHNAGTSGLAAVAQLAALIRACIERNSPPGSSYRRDAAQIPVVAPAGFGLARPEQHLRAILVALREDYAQDRVRSFEEVVHAQVFNDLFEEATTLLKTTHRLAATVVAGAAFEEHLRLLATRNGLDLVDRRGKPIGASTWNTELRTKARLYDLTVEDQNQVWIGYRNQAAHNKPEFQSRTDDDIEKMIAGARAFIAAHPA